MSRNIKLYIDNLSYHHTGYEEVKFKIIYRKINRSVGITQGLLAQLIKSEI